MRLYDTHAHLDYAKFEADFEDVLDRAEKAGVQKIIAIGTDFDSSRRSIELAERNPAVYAAVGWHPSYADAAPDDIRNELRAMAKHPRVVAIGETGLDYSRLPKGDAGEVLKRAQSRLFGQQLEVAAELGLNCVVHQRECFTETLAQIRPYAGKLSAVFHCFVGSPEEMRLVIGSGFLVSFTGIATFKNGVGIRETISATPLEALMVETDAPYLAPEPHRGKRCEPAHARLVAECVASVKQVSLDEISRVTCATAERFFKGIAD